MAGFKSFLNSISYLSVGTAVHGGAGTIMLPTTGSVLFDPTSFTAGLYGPSEGNAGAIGVVSDNNTAGLYLFWVQDSDESTSVFGVISQGANLAGVKTTPIASQAPTGGNLALGTAWHNTNNYDVMLLISLAITANTSLVVSLGVGPTSTPTQQTLISGTTSLGVFVVPIKVPAGYWALLSNSGTGTITVVGQLQENS